MNLKTSLPIAVLVTLAGANWHAANAAAAAVEPAGTQAYPTRPIRLIVPIAPGGGTDILSRIIGQKMGESFRQQVVIDNRQGAGSVIGTDIAAKSTPDGYTLVMVFPAHAVNVTLMKKLPFDPVRDFAPVTLCASAPYVLVVHPSLPAKSVKSLIELARAQPGKLNYSSGGTGTSPHLSAELFKSAAGVNITAIPYNGGGPALAAALAGEVQVNFGVIPAALPLVKSGRLVALGVTSRERSKLTPDLPTVAEAGVPGYESIAWYGVLAPAHTPAPVIQKLDREIQRILALPDVQERLAGLGFEPIPSTPEKFGAYIRAEIPKWAKVIRDANIQAE